MSTCPDCFEVKTRLSDNHDFEIIDIGEHVRNLKEFIRLRDSSPAFDSVRANGCIDHLIGFLPISEQSIKYFCITPGLVVPRKGRILSEKRQRVRIYPYRGEAS